MEQITERRDVEVIAAEIRIYKGQAGDAILAIGRNLIEAKEQLNHGEWLPWLQDRCEFSEVAAQRFMRLAREYQNPSLVTDLGTSKALALLAIPESEREEFATEKHDVDGQEMTVAEMTKRQLEQVIKERDEAKKKLAEEREESEGTALRLSELESTVTEQQNKIAGYDKIIAQKTAAAEAERDELSKENADLREQLETLQSAPAEVIVEKVKDEEAVKKAFEDGAASAEKRLGLSVQNAKLDAEKAKQRVSELNNRIEDEKKKRADEIEKIRYDAKLKTESLERENTEMRKRLAAANAGVALFKLHFQRAQEEINGMIETLRQMEDADLKSKLQAAMRSLAESIVGAAKT